MFRTIIPQEERARVIHWNGKISIVDGPYRLPLLAKADIFEKEVIPDGEQGYLIDENGNYQEMIGPTVVYIHPEGEYRPHRRFDLANHEAMVVIDEEGKYNIYLGSTTPSVWVKDRQRVYQFHWTGSRGDTEEKSPGALNIQILRLQDTQTYFSFQVRTNDNVVITLRLMIYYSYTSVEKLLSNNDPLGAMYNKIMATLVDFVATLDFDEFKENTNEKIARHELFTDGRTFFQEFGIDVQQIVVRAWEPIDRQVQAVLERAAMIQTQKTLDEAEHERKMNQFDYEEKELVRASQLDAQRAQTATAEGNREAVQLAAMYDGLKEQVGGPVAQQLLKLKVAGTAQALYISPQLLEANATT